MKTKTKKIKAGVLAIAALFILVAFAGIVSADVPATIPRIIVPGFEMSGVRLGVEYEENADFTLPEGVSCRSVVVRVLCPYSYFYMGNLVVGTFDRGFNFYLVKRCDGQQHSFVFHGQIRTNYEDGGTGIILPLDIGPITWDSNSGIGIDLLWRHRETWYNEKYLDGTGTRDIGDPIPVHKEYHGLLFYLPEEFVASLLHTTTII